MSTQLKSLVEEINDIVEARKAPGFAELSVWNRIRVLAPSIAEAACVALYALDPQKIQQVWPQYADAAEKLFDEIVVPLDIPKLGPIAELAAENFLRKLIRPAIEGFAKRLAA